MDRYIYALELEDDFYYVGQTTNIERRFHNHKNEKGAIWTFYHKPKRIIETRKVKAKDEIEALIHENCLTISYMRKYGWERVRGGDYCVYDEDLLFRMLKGRFDLATPEMKPLYDPNLIYKPNYDKVIYVLSLENDCYYIGSSTNLSKSLKKHFAGTASIWSEINPAIKLVETRPNPDDKFKIYQNSVTLEYMKLYGWQNVRGGDFLIIDELNHQKLLKSKTNIFFP